MSYPFVDHEHDISGKSTDRAPKSIRRRHVIHVPLLLISLAAVLLLTVGVFFLLRYQVRRAADSLLSRAEELENAGRYADAAIYLRHYQALLPEDGAIYKRLATVSDKGLAESRDSRDRERVVRLYLRAIGFATPSESIELRKRVCELLFEQERYTLAEAQSDALVKTQPEDPEGWRLLALSIYGKLAHRAFVPVEDTTGEKISLGHALERSLQLNPVDVKMAGLLAEIYRQHPDLLSPEQKQRVQSRAEARLAATDVRLAMQLPEIANLDAEQARRVRVAALELERMKKSQCARLADQIFESMLASAPENALVWAARFDYRDQYKLPGGSADLKRALELAPHDVRLLLAAGQQAMRQAESLRGSEKMACLRGANRYFQGILAAPDPTWRGSVTDRGQREEQKAIVRQATLGLGQVAMARGDPRQAIQWFRDGSAGVGKEDIRFSLYLVDAQLMAGQQEEAAAELQRAAARMKEKSPTFRSSTRLALRRSMAMVQGKLYLHEGKPVDAIREFKWVVLDDETNQSARELTFHAFRLMGMAYARLEQWDLAGASFEQALEARPSRIDVLQLAVFAWRKANRLQKVVDLYMQYLPESRDTHARLELAEALLQVQQELAPSERDWAPLEEARGGIREVQSQLDASQMCRVLLLDVEHTLARLTELLTLERTGKVLHAMRVEQGENEQGENEQGENEQEENEQEVSRWNFQESHLSFLQRLLPELDVESACRVILNISSDSSARAGEEKSVQQLVRALCLLQLREATERVPALDPLRWRICRLYENLGSPREADVALGRLKTSQPVSVDTLIPHVQLFIRRRNFDAARELFKTPFVTSASAEDKLLLEDARIDLELREGSAGGLELARKLLEARHHDRPRDTHVVWQLALLSLRQKKSPEAHEWTNTLRRLEGDEENEGVLSKHIELLQLLAGLEHDSGTDRSTLERAHTLAGQIVKHRPYWPEGWILSARLASHESRWKDAAAAYRKAIQFGAVAPDIYQELISLLFRLGDYHGANRYLERIRPDIGTSTSLSALAMSVSTRLGDNKSALELAWERVNESPDDPVAWLWLSRMQWVNGLRTVAEKSIRKARELAPRDVRIAYTQFAYRVETGQIDEARKLLREIGENATFGNPVERCLVKARGYESLGNGTMAGEQYRRSAELAPKDVAIQLQVASFFLDRDTSLAEKYLRTALALQPDSLLARRNLSSLLLAKGTAEARDEAQELLDPQDRSERGQRLRAMLLLQQRPPSLDSARRILERLVESKARESDRFLLANVYLLDSALHAEKDKRLHRLEQARTHYHFLAVKQEPQSAHVMRYVDFLLRYQSREEAARWLPALREATLDAHDPDLENALRYLEFLVAAGFVEQAGKEIDADMMGTGNSEPDLLERTIDLYLQTGKNEKAGQRLEILREMRPKSFSTVARQARWLCGLHRESEVPTLIEPFADRWINQQGGRSEHARLAMHVARLYAELGLNKAAERWFRKLMEYDPQQYEPLAQHLAQQRNWPELMALLAQVIIEDSSVHPATLLARSLTFNTPPSQVREVAEQRFGKMLDAHPDNFDLLVAIAGFRQHQGHYSNAAELYERALQVQSDHVEALSRLAQCLSHETDSIPRAFASIDQALRMAGPQADLLAIKGMVYHYAGHSAEGVDLLQAAAATVHADPKHKFYYALVLMRLHALDQARKVWRGLATEELAPLLDADERNQLLELQQVLQ